MDLVFDLFPNAMFPPSDTVEVPESAMRRMDSDEQVPVGSYNPSESFVVRVLSGDLVAVEQKKDILQAQNSRKLSRSKGVRALQEAQRVAKVAAKAEGRKLTPVSGGGATSKPVKQSSQKKDTPAVASSVVASDKKGGDRPRDRRKDVPPPRMQFDDKSRVEKAKRRAVVNQTEAKNRVELFRHLPQYERGTQLPDLESKFFQLDLQGQCEWCDKRNENSIPCSIDKITKGKTKLRRLKVQSTKWRKTAEEAAAILSARNKGKFVDKTSSLDSHYNPLSSPYSNDLDDDSPKACSRGLVCYGRRAKSRWNYATGFLSLSGGNHSSKHEAELSHVGTVSCSFAAVCANL